ncbi:MAG: hypothetical protein ACK5PJ_02775 [Ralstonia sp.]
MLENKKNVRAVLAELAVSHVKPFVDLIADDFSYRKAVRRSARIESLSANGCGASMDD